MDEYIKLFETHSEYETYIQGDSKVFPNVSLCKDQSELHYNAETRIIATFDVESTDDDIQLCVNTGDFNQMEIDGVIQPNVVSDYRFNTTGKHVVKYTLINQAIERSMFSECEYMTSVIIPNNVTKIEDYAFEDCYNLKFVNIGNNVTDIWENAFTGCSGLTSITIPNSVTSIGDEAFSGCSSLASVTIPNSVTSIGRSTFYGCTSLASVTIPNSVTSIGQSAFGGSGLTSITIPNSVTTIGGSAFYGCNKLTSITCNATTAPTITNNTFRNIKTGGTLTVPIGSTGYDDWMNTGNYYLGLYNWTKVEQ